MKKLTSISPTQKSKVQGNDLRKQMEVVAQISKRMPEWDEKRVSFLTDRSVGFIRNRKALLEAHQSVTEAIYDGVLTNAVAQALIVFTDEDLEKQHNLVQKFRMAAASNDKDSKRALVDLVMDRARAKKRTGITKSRAKGLLSRVCRYWLDVQRSHKPLNNNNQAFRKFSRYMEKLRTLKKDGGLS